MSIAYFIASDYPLPAVDLRTAKTFFVKDITITIPAGFGVYQPYHSDDKNFIKKNYYYEISFEADDICVEYLRQYLIGNMKSKIEIWCIWLGTGGILEIVNSLHHIYPISIKNISRKDIDMLYDDIDWYYENNVVIVPEKRVTSIESLTKDDILFILDNRNVVLIIEK